MAYESVLNRKPKSHWLRNSLLVVFGAASIAGWAGYNVYVKPVVKQAEAAYSMGKKVIYTLSPTQTVDHSANLSCTSSDGDKAAFAFDKSAHKVAGQADGQKFDASYKAGKTLSVNDLISGGGDWSCSVNGAKHSGPTKLSF
jgi:hypothetical protein